MEIREIEKNMLHKQLLAHLGDRLDWDDLLEQFEERAGILEFEGKLDRAEAERIAAEGVRGIVEARRARIAR